MPATNFSWFRHLPYRACVQPIQFSGDQWLGQPCGFFPQLLRRSCFTIATQFKVVCIFRIFRHKKQLRINRPGLPHTTKDKSPKIQMILTSCSQRAPPGKDCATRALSRKASLRASTCSPPWGATLSWPAIPTFNSSTRDCHFPVVEVMFHGACLQAFRVSSDWSQWKGLVLHHFAVGRPFQKRKPFASPA